MSHARFERREIDVLQPADVKRVVCMRLLLEKKGAEHRHERERKNERAEQRERDREGERAEHFSFESLQGEERQKDEDDDENAEDDRAADFLRRVKHGLDFAAVRDARRRRSVSVRCRWMFSTITTAPSTIMPMPMARPPNDIRFALSPTISS